VVRCNGLFRSPDHRRFPFPWSKKLRDRSNIAMTQLLFFASPEFECHSLWTRFGSRDLNTVRYKMSTSVMRTSFKPLATPPRLSPSCADRFDI